MKRGVLGVLEEGDIPSSRTPPLSTLGTRSSALRASDFGPSVEPHTVADRLAPMVTSYDANEQNKALN